MITRLRPFADRMIRKLSGAGTRPVVIPHCPDGQRIYCIGDIHGRSDLLRQLHRQIEQDARNHEGRRTLIYLGDYIDRGDDSRGVIDLLLEQPLPGFEPIYLRGNHEQVMLDFLQEPRVAQSWLSFGGMPALLSYGVRVSRIPAGFEDSLALQQALIARLPEAHLRFLRNTRHCHQAGSYYFVHAGVRPGIPLARQRPADQLWIREEFLAQQQPWEKIIVHGHSISDRPQLLAQRIGIDTGAYLSGVLTALVLEADHQRILHT